MARVEPGLYEPSDDVRVFDGAEDDYDDEGSRLPLLIVIALLVLAAFAGVVWLAYTQGVQRGRQDVPRVIAAESGPVKTAPGQLATANPYKGLKIYNNKAPADAQASNGNALPSIITQPGEPLFSAFGPKHPAPAAPGAKQATPAAPPPAQRVAVQTPAPAQAKPAPVHVAPPPPHPPAQKAVAVPPPPKPAPAPVVAMIAPTPPPAAVPAATGAYVAQVAAFKSQAEAEAGWATFKRNHAATVAGMGPNIVSVDLGEKGTWYRLRTGSFPDKAAAADFCAKLKAEGGSCLPAKG
jgi:hypothetical protein